MIINHYESLWLLITINDWWWLVKTIPSATLKTIPHLGIPRQTPACADSEAIPSPGDSGRLCVPQKVRQSRDFMFFASCWPCWPVLARGWQEWWCGKSIEITEKSPWFVWFCGILGWFFCEGNQCGNSGDPFGSPRANPKSANFGSIVSLSWRP